MVIILCFYLLALRVVVSKIKIRAVGPVGDDFTVDRRIYSRDISCAL
ncbi:hypothetical protein V1280_007666 [Bradyrhizobium sp. AZCC 2230]